MLSVQIWLFTGAKTNLRDYSGHLAFYYLKMKEPEGPEEDGELRECLLTPPVCLGGHSAGV